MTKKTKVLITIDWFTPGYKAGGPIQSCANIVAHLRHEIDFYILTRDTDYCETVPYKSVSSDSWNQVAGNVQVYYCSSRKLTFRNLSRLIKEVAPDTAFVNGIYSLYFSILPLLILKRLKHPNIIVSARGMLAQSAIQVKGEKKKLFLRGGKVTGLYRGIRFHATHEGERQDIQQVFGRQTEVVIAPNLPKKTSAQAHVSRHKKAGALRLVSVARISPEKNTKYALEVLVQYTGEEEIVFDIYGPVYDESYWQECRELMQQVPRNVAVLYKGSLESQLVASTLAKYHALFMPTRGENFGHIILESFTAGCPVIISDQTPWKHLLELGIGFALPLRDQGGFVSAIKLLAEKDQQEYDTFSQQAYLYAQQYLNNDEGVKLNQLMLQ